MKFSAFFPRRTLMNIQVLVAPGFTRQHAAINCLAAILDHKLVLDLEPDRVLTVIIGLITVATTEYAPLAEWSNPDLSFQRTHQLLERNPTVIPNLTKILPREAFLKFIYTQNIFEQHFDMVLETALRIAARALLSKHRVALRFGHHDGESSLSNAKTYSSILGLKLKTGECYPCLNIRSEIALLGTSNVNAEVKGSRPPKGLWRSKGNT